MKKFLLPKIGLIAAVSMIPLVSQAGKNIVEGRTITVNQANMHHSRMTEFGFDLLKAPRLASESDVTVKPTITTASGEQIIFCGAVRTVDGVVEAYGGEDWGDGIEEFTIPAGTYTFFLYGVTKRSAGSIFLVKENVEVAEGFEISFDTADAVHQTNIVQRGPSGDVLYCDYDNEGTVGDAEDVILYNGAVAYWSGMDLYYNQMNYVKTNVTETDLEFVRMFNVPSKADGMLFSVLPVDFSKEEVGATPEGWMTVDEEFAITPVKKLDEEAWRELGMPEDEIPYTFIKYFLSFDGMWRGMIGSGITGPGFNSGKIGFYQPDGFDTKLAFVVFPMGSVVAGADSSIKAMPVVWSPDGVKQLGLNPVLDPNFFYTTSGRSFENTNPAFTGTPTKGIVGNCTPALVTAPEGSQVTFGYVGRLGESFDVDSWNMAAKYPNADLLGTDTNKVTVTIDGETVCSERVDYPDAVTWGKTGVYEINFSTNNVLIDDELPGIVKGTLTYDAATYGGLIPTLTMMQFKSTDGDVTDRFDSSSDATMSLYASTLKYNRTSGSASTRYVYYDYTTPEAVEVEWAATGSDDFKSLTVEADPDGDFIPGFGNHYNISLADITAEGWVDVRITVKAESGATQVQTITPAIKIGENSGVASMTDETSEAATIYYNLQGIRIAAPEAGQLVIRRQGDIVSKIVIK